MPALSMMVAPTPDGWGVFLSDGRQLASFRGIAARWRALRYLTNVTGLRAELGDGAVSRRGRPRLFARSRGDDRRRSRSGSPLRHAGRRHRQYRPARRVQQLPA